MSELKADWKSAVDPASGRTYWYHRVSRVSTWERPNFIEDAHADDHLNDPANAGSYEGPEEDSTPEDDNEAAYNLLRDIQNSVGQKQIELLEKLYFNIISTNCTYWATLDGLVETLVFFSASDVERDVRIASLKCLCTLAIDRAVASTVFCSNTTWLEIAEAMLHWKNEYISLICASCLFATLLIGPTSVLIDNTIRTSIERLLQNVFDDSQTGSSYFSLYHRPGTNDYGLINERVLQLWMLVAKAGHSLAAWLVLVTMNVALR